MHTKILAAYIPVNGVRNQYFFILTPSGDKKVMMNKNNNANIYYLPSLGPDVSPAHEPAAQRSPASISKRPADGILSKVKSKKLNV